MMKFLITFPVLAACLCGALVPSVYAAKVVTTWTVSSAVTDFQVDDQGSLFQIITAQDADKSLATVSWLLARS